MRRGGEKKADCCLKCPSRPIDTYQYFRLLVGPQHIGIIFTNQEMFSEVWEISMILVWRGWGLLFPLGVCLSVLAVVFLSMPFEAYVNQDLLVIPAALAAAAGGFATAYLLERSDKGREVIDPKTGQRILLVRGDSLFFIPVKYWSYLVAVGSMCAIGFALNHYFTGA